MLPSRHRYFLYSLTKETSWISWHQDRRLFRILQLFWEKMNNKSKKMYSIVIFKGIQ